MRLKALAIHSALFVVTWTIAVAAITLIKTSRLVINENDYTLNFAEVVLTMVVFFWLWERFSFQRIALAALSVISGLAVADYYKFDHNVILCEANFYMNYIGSYEGKCGKAVRNTPDNTQIRICRALDIQGSDFLYYIVFFNGDQGSLVRGKFNAPRENITISELPFGIVTYDAYLISGNYFLVIFEKTKMVS